MAIVNEFGEPRSDINFSFTVTDYTQESLKLQFEFEEPELISETGVNNDRIQITFWGTEYFKNEEGVEVPFGA